MTTPSKEPIHRIRTPGSVQALVLDSDILFAGLEGGIIAAYSLDTFELVASVQAHEDSVLGLHLCQQHDLLFSTGADSVVNVWSTQSLQPQYSLHSYHEVGDVFSIGYSTRMRTIFFGSQNGSLGWYQLRDQRNGDFHGVAFSPGIGKHRFFDSRGPGGSQDPLQLRDPNGALIAGGTRSMIPDNYYHPYAHKSYVYSLLLIKGLIQHDTEEEVLITGGGGGTIKLWRLENINKNGLVELFKFRNKGSSVLSLTYTGTFLYAGLADGHAHIYNLSSRQLVQKLSVGQGNVTQIQISCGSIICGTSEGWLKQYNSRFAEVAQWKAHDGKILASDHEQTPTRKLCATGGNDNTIALWDPKDPSSQSAAQAAQSDDELLRALRQFVTYKTVSKIPRYASECHEAVTFLRKICSAFGAATSLLSPGEGVSPILLAKFVASNDPTESKNVLFYGHYDVVDAEQAGPGSASTWRGDPFYIEPLNGFFYGRGVSDNKGPILAAIFAAADLAQQGLLSCNVTFLLEGDEEAGSRGFRSTVKQHRDAIGPVDHILLSNSYWLDDHVPCLTFGMRGVVHATIQITSDRPDLHSGMDGKSVQHEPLKDMTVLLGSILGPNGTDIKIPGFADSVDKLTEGEANVYHKVASSLLTGHPEIKSQQEFAQSLMQRWRYPNLTIHQISVPEAKTAVTISRTAQATLSIRIVPSQTAEAVAHGLSRHLEASFEKLGSNNSLSIKITSKADPWLGNPRSPIFQALRSAIVDVWAAPAAETSGRSFPTSGTSTPTTAEAPVSRPSQRRASTLASHGTFTPSNTPHEPLFIREGGSIPAISFLEREFDADAAMFPMGQASDNAHLDNERIRVENLYKGREVLKRVFGTL